MSRGPRLTLILLALCAGCASPGPVDPSAERARWERLSVRLRGPSPAVPPTTDPAEVCDAQRLRRASEGGHAALVRIETRLAPDNVAPDADPAVRPTAQPSGGTGVVIAASGVILTNAHVVRGATELHAVLADGTAYPALCVAVDPRLDVALLRIAATELPILAPADGHPDIGASVAALGYTGGTPVAGLRLGVITDTAASLQAQLDPTGVRCYDGLLECTARLEPGFSGGPLLDQAGRLIGLNVAVAGHGDAQRGYALPFTAATRAAIARLAQRL